ncbi:ABC transporter ATP-binding protein [Xylanibacillus composti]|uniref:Multidrug ABC transporter ATP-binding protein n=1 Tax=Xylanibacillus composti TaxID=1572762 RepID=A0A8J4H2D5_9BACL|nr:ABC-F type ribosomal protection protein [Xylanibacillus composti]MDT9723838.1 ABC transporter ATP-binding protein [Xylanibacillus composti]GIQ67383.1 multidrug ABC transporter ATP-binding protein [Xylanibacillus composti]
MLLQGIGITKSYGTTPILTDIHIQVEEKEKIGLVGVNGAGKSTLLRILAGIDSADSGDIIVPKQTKIGYLAQHSGLNSELSMWDELMTVYAPLTEMEERMRQLEQRMSAHDEARDPLAMEALLQQYDELSHQFRMQGGYEMEANVRGILNGMGFGDMPFDTPVSALSGGQKTRLALAKILLQAPELLMLDEPTNYLDIATLTWLEAYLKQYKGAILIVSHDRFFLDAVVGSIYEIERTKAKRYTGNYSKFIETKAKDLEIEQKHYEKQQQEIQKMEDFVRRNLARASTTKRAQSRRKALEKLERLERPAGELKRASFSFRAARASGNDVLTVEQLSVGYPEQEPLFRHASFHLERGETVALIGPNGIGKSSLLKTLMGQIPAREGSIRWGAKTDVAYYDQEHTSLNPNNTVLEEVWSAFPHKDELSIRTVLGNFLFSGEDVEKPVGSLSGGERARVALSKLMLLEANVLILDEPTNHLDLYSKEILESALLDFEGTLLFISHDRYFLNKMSERVIELGVDGIQHFLGNYDDYVEKKAELAELAEHTAGSSQSGKQTMSAQADKGASSYEAEKQAKREERNRQRKLEQCEKQIAELEEQLTEMELRMAEPEVFQDYVKLQELEQQISAVKSKLQELYEEWEALAE